MKISWEDIDKGNLAILILIFIVGVMFLMVYHIFGGIILAFCLFILLRDFIIIMKQRRNI